MVRPITCPICDAQLAVAATTESPLFPFCSKRCKQIDLLRWTEGRYAIADSLTPDRLVEELGIDPEGFEDRGQ